MLKDLKDAGFLLDVCVCVFSLSVVSDSLRPMDYNPPGSFVHGIL